LFNYSRHNIIIDKYFSNRDSGPVVVTIKQTASPPTIESRVAADGARFTWAEFDSYFDADVTAAMGGC